MIGVVEIFASIKLSITTDMLDSATYSGRSAGPLLSRNGKDDVNDVASQFGDWAKSYSMSVTASLIWLKRAGAGVEPNGRHRSR